MGTPRSIGILLAAAMVSSCGMCCSRKPSGGEAGEAHKPAELVLELGEGLPSRLVLVPAGRFWMGSPDGEPGRRADEGPARRVTIGEPFYMGLTEVTQDQYEAVMGSNPSRRREGGNPVDSVSWEEAAEFCRRLAARTGRPAGLPTEAQWEYACRAGTDGPFHTGATIRADQANYNGQKVYASGVRGVARPGPVAAGSLPPNAWGLHEMHGNVLEWCADWYAASYESAAARDPRGPAGGTERVLRGGFWMDGPRDCRSACREKAAPKDRRICFGFRVAASAAGLSGERLELALGGGRTMRLALIRAGEFRMGSPDGGLDRYEDEGLRHAVTIRRAFYLGAHEVTRREFAAFAAATGYRTEAEREGWAYSLEGTNFREARGLSWRSPGFAQGDDHPAVCVSHDDARAYCRWVSETFSVAAALPTEAQWEYACRAGSTSAFPWGEQAEGGEGFCNAAGQEARGAPVRFPWSDGHVFTSPAGAYRANAFALHDMIGNAWEWCGDWYAPSYPAAGAVDPAGPPSGTARVARGGSWTDGPKACRPADRRHLDPHSRVNCLGFRLAVAADDAAPEVSPDGFDGPDGAGAASDTGSEAMGRYTVRGRIAGAWGMAQRVYGNGAYYWVLEDANPGVDWNHLRPGQVLLVPPRPEGGPQRR